jgi:hypothetical protein
MYWGPHACEQVKSFTHPRNLVSSGSRHNRTNGSLIQWYETLKKNVETALEFVGLQRWRKVVSRLRDRRDISRDGDTPPLFDHCPCGNNHTRSTAETMT